MRLRFGTHGGDKLGAEYFFRATENALKNAFAETEFAVLEPVMHVEVDIPVDSVLDVLADFGLRRGRIESQETVCDGMVRVGVRCPAEEVLEYEGELRGLTGEGAPFL